MEPEKIHMTLLDDVNIPRSLYLENMQMDLTIDLKGNTWTCENMENDVLFEMRKNVYYNGQHCNIVLEDSASDEKTGSICGSIVNEIGSILLNGGTVTGDVFAEEIYVDEGTAGTISSEQIWVSLDPSVLTLQKDGKKCAEVAFDADMCREYCGKNYSKAGEVTCTVTPEPEYNSKGQALKFHFVQPASPIAEIRVGIRGENTITAVADRLTQGSFERTYSGMPVIEYYLEDQETKTAPDNSGALGIGEAPVYAGTYYAKVAVEDEEYFEKTEWFSIKIDPAQPTLILQDRAGDNAVVYNGSAAEIGSVLVTGDFAEPEKLAESVIYTYYTDRACEQEHLTTAENGAETPGAAPKNIGTYYVKAVFAADRNYREAVSNAAVLEIKEQTPQNPDVSQNPQSQSMPAKRSLLRDKKTNVEIFSKVTIGGASYQVTAIEKKAFYKNRKITKLIIPNSIKKIGAYACYGCKKLKNITIKTTKLTGKTVGSKALKGISEKASIRVPKSKVKTYQKLLKQKGAGKKVKIRK